MRTLSSIMYGVFVALVIAVALLFFVPTSPFSHYVEVKIVKSGSMEPTIMTGSIVVISPKVGVTEGDIITFNNRSSNIPTTHRIVGTEVVRGTPQFVTKGDANEERDTETVTQGAVIGKVLFSIPYVGYILDFARQPLGFALLIGIPALLIVLDEIGKIWAEIRRRRHDRRNVVQSELPKEPHALTALERPRAMDIRRISRTVATVPVRVSDAMVLKGAHDIRSRRPEWIVSVASVVAILITVVNVVFAGGTIAYFSDTESSLGNRMRASALDFTAVPQGTSFTFIDGVLDDPSGLGTVVAPETGSVPVRYALRTEFVSGNSLLCDAITVEVTDPFTYSGPLSELGATEVAFDGPWTPALSLLATSTYVSGDTCVVDVVYDGWNSALAEAFGYSDEERVQLMFTVLESPPAEGFQLLAAPALFENVVVEGSTTPESTDQPQDENDDSSKNHGKNKDVLPHQNNGHGNDADHNDDSNPGSKSNDPDDVTDDEAVTEEGNADVIMQEAEDDVPVSEDEEQGSLEEEHISDDGGVVAPDEEPEPPQTEDEGTPPVSDTDTSLGTPETVA